MVCLLSLFSNSYWVLWSCHAVFVLQTALISVWQFVLIMLNDMSACRWIYLALCYTMWFVKSFALQPERGHTRALSWRILTWLRDASTLTGCGAERSTRVLAGKRREGVARPAYLWLRCTLGGCAPDSTLRGNWPSEAERENLDSVCRFFPVPPVCLLLWDLYLLNHWHTRIICT